MIIFFLLSENILFVGDSHTKGYFGENLKKILTQSNNTVKVLAEVGSGVDYWTKDKNFIDQVKNTDEVIIALGTNDFASYRKCQNKTICFEKKIKTMLDLIPPEKNVHGLDHHNIKKALLKTFLTLM